jgi:ABC-2 type transport system permease protein
MKVFAEERKTKTEQLLLTSPVSLFGIVMGKYLAAFSVFASGILVSCFNFILLYEYGSVETATLIGSVIIVLLIGGACIAVGVFVSSLTENQFVSCIITMAILLILVGTSILEGSVSATWLKTILSWISILSRFTNFTYGIFDIPALIYYISLSSIFVFLTVRVLEKRRWN